MDIFDNLENNTAMNDNTLDNLGMNGDILDNLGIVDKPNSIIKVIGVGGGGGNAVNHMYHEGIHDVSFVLCNTDAQALRESPVPVHIQLGKEGLGAGNRPERARAAAEESIEDVQRMLNDGTRMTFITAGMGGGTGTGAAPIIARESKKLDILTVGIVTIPFRFEGDMKIDQALDGVEEMSKNVDALLVINNERLRQIYGELSLIEAFKKADDTLSVAAKSIAEIITVYGNMNLDFNDVRTVLKEGGVAIMSTGYGEGEGRLKKAIDDALNSPLLNDNDVFKSKKILIFISFNSDNSNRGLMIEEMNDLNDFMSKFDKRYELKWGYGTNPSLGDKIKVTILATGFGLSDINEEMANRAKQTAIEDIAKIAEEEELKAKAAARRGRYYGKEAQNAPQKRRPNIYYFSAADLDNEDLILAVEDTPTYGRLRQTLEEITRLSVDYHKNDEENAEQGSDDNSGVIKFS